MLTFSIAILEFLGFNKLIQNLGNIASKLLLVAKVRHKI
jgi:hypothetical protein